MTLKALVQVELNKAVAEAIYQIYHHTGILKNNSDLALMAAFWFKTGVAIDDFVRSAIKAYHRYRYDNRINSNIKSYDW